MTNLVNSNPLVSVSIPTYNNAKLITETLNSVQNQTYKNLEIIVVDDGSTDNTEAVVRDLMKSDPRIRYKKIVNSRSPTARNTGFKISNGEYVASLDSDDLWPENRIEVQLQALSHNPNAIVLGSVQRFLSDESGTIRMGEVSFLPPKGNDYLHSLLKLETNQMVNFNTFCAKREIICSDGLWDPTFVTAHDWENWIRLAKKHPFIHLESILQLYRKHESSTTASHNVYRALDYQLCVIEKHTPRGIRFFWKKLTYKRLRYQSFIAALIYENNPRDAIKLWAKASIRSNLLFKASSFRQLLEIAREHSARHRTSENVGNV